MGQQPLRTVLIVDDESSIREMLAVALEMAGFETIQAENASSALEHLTSRLPDLMLVDWMMPQVSGLELCRRLRRNADTANFHPASVEREGDCADAGTPLSRPTSAGKRFLAA